MAARLAPYPCYYASRRPTDDHLLARPAVLIVFEDELVASHFFRVAREEIEGAAVNLPLLVSHGRLLGKEGPLGSAWLSPGGGERGYAFRRV